MPDLNKNTNSIYLTAVNDVSINGNFHKSVIEGIPDKEILSEVSVNRNAKLFLWGITEKSTTTFNKIETNSFILFYHKGFIIGYSKVINKIVNKELSYKLFGNFTHLVSNEKLYWSNILVLTYFTPLKLDFTEIIKLGAYKDKFSIRRIIELNEIAKRKIIKQEDSIEKYLQKFVIK